MDHVILTRFNLPSLGAESVVRARHDWLTRRVELFERYCLPSVRAQTRRHFRWIIYFDPESPDWLQEKIRAHAQAGHYTPIFRTQVSRAELVADITSLFDTRSDELLTTNLDNDDALAADFVERLQAQPRPCDSTAYYLTTGLVRSGGAVYLHRDRRNAYPSLRERWDAPITCWADWHNRLSRHVPVVEIGGEPGWLQVVHGGNVSNRTRGRLIAPSAYRPLFGTLLDDIAEPGGGALARDRLLGRPRRVVRDVGRRVLKTVALRVLGPSGFERAKHLLATRTRA
jgi:Putative rhamnosyl transferase